MIYHFQSVNFFNVKFNVNNCLKYQQLKIDVKKLKLNERLCFQVKFILENQYLKMSSWSDPADFS
jgi:hypothetical protein